MVLLVVCSMWLLLTGHATAVIPVQLQCRIKFETGFQRVVRLLKLLGGGRRHGKVRRLDLNYSVLFLLLKRR